MYGGSSSKNNDDCPMSCIECLELIFSINESQRTEKKKRKLQNEIKNFHNKNSIESKILLIKYYIRTKYYAELST